MKRDAMQMLRDAMDEMGLVPRDRAVISRHVNALLRERADAACDAFMSGPRSSYEDECDAIRAAVLGKRGGK